MIALDDINSDIGCLQRLLIAESRTPGHGAYKFDEIKLVLQAMKAVIVNRKNLGKSYLFCSAGAISVSDFICAPVSASGCQAKQFEGFNKVNGAININASIMSRIIDAVNIANNSTDPRSQRYSQHINEVIRVSQTSIADPYSAIPDIINGERVLKGVYGWRTAGSANPGGAFTKVPQVTPPLNHPNGNIQGIQFYTIKSIATFVDEENFNKFFSPPLSSNSICLEEEMVGEWQLTMVDTKANGRIKFSFSNEKLSGVFEPGVSADPKKNVENIHITSESIDFTVEGWGTFHFVKDTPRHSENIWVSKRNTEDVEAVFFKLEL